MCRAAPHFSHSQRLSLFFTLALYVWYYFEGFCLTGFGGIWHGKWRRSVASRRIVNGVRTSPSVSKWRCFFNDSFRKTCLLFSTTSFLPSFHGLQHVGIVDGSIKNVKNKNLLVPFCIPSHNGKQMPTAGLGGQHLSFLCCSFVLAVSALGHSLCVAFFLCL